MMLELSLEDLNELLLLEKERRSIENDQILFVGMANVASYYWCAMKSLLASKKNELGFFRAYLEDRVKYSFELGYIDSIPTNKERLLDIGDKITLEDIEKLLREKAQRMPDVYEGAIGMADKEGRQIMVVNPELPPEEKKWYEEEAKKEGYSIASIEEFPLLRGELLESTKAERYPTIRWNFPWRDYVIVGVPDGITNEFVYEFKTTRNKFLMYYIKPVAFTQVDLYGYFFKRSTKRVQVYIVEEDKTLTWMENVDPNNAEGILRKFKRLEKEMETAIPPKKWKCKKCEFKETCPLYQKGRV